MSALELLSFGPTGWGDELAAGTLLTVQLALATLPFGLFLGFLVALAKNSEHPEMAAAAHIYTTLFRGLPELLTLLIIFYGGQILFQKVVAAFGGGYIEVNAFVAGMIALGIVFSAYSSEVFLGAFKAIPKGQYEGGYAVGLTHFQTMLLIITPQLIRLALPGLSNLWLILLKDTSLVMVIALQDLLRTTNIAVGVTKEPFLFYFVACMIYLVLAIISSFGINGIESWAKRGERGRS